jgi:signal transduction histidine kinase
VPLKVKSDLIGVIYADNRIRSGIFRESERDLLTAFANQAAVAIENARLILAERKAYEQLGELDKLKSDFISIASHELRTPLSLILLYAAVLREEVGVESRAQLDAVLRAATRLKHIMETMLNLRYLETGQLDLMPTRFDLREEVRGVCADYEALAGTGGLSLDMDVPDEEMLIYADRENVRVILDNLVSNAVRFTPAGGRVRVKLCRQGTDLEVSVVDTGVGIPEADLERVFDRFYQVEDHLTRRQGGMGLGLAIVKGLVKLHGGRVWAESVQGRGSRFVIVLPPYIPGTVPGEAEFVGPFIR